MLKSLSPIFYNNIVFDESYVPNFACLEVMKFDCVIFNYFSKFFDL